MAYKILNNKVILGPDYLPRTILQTQRPYRNCNMSTVGSEYHLVEPSSRLQVTKPTFFFDTPKLWNQRITKVQAQAPSVDSFKNQLDKNDH